MCALAHTCLHTHTIKENIIEKAMATGTLTKLFLKMLFHVCFLESSVNGSRKFSARCQGNDSIKEPYPAVTPMNNDNYQHGKICIKCSKWPSHVGGHKQLSNWNLGPIQQEENHTWSWKPSKLSRTGAAMNCRKESTTNILLGNIIPYYL